MGGIADDRNGAEADIAGDKSYRSAAIPCAGAKEGPHPPVMLYDAYEVQRSFLAGASKLAGLGAGWLTNPANPLAYASTSPLVAASLEVFAHATAPHGKPEFGIRSVKIGPSTGSGQAKDVAVREEIVLRKP